MTWNDLDLPKLFHNQSHTKVINIFVVGLQKVEIMCYTFANYNLMSELIQKRDPLPVSKNQTVHQFPLCR